LEIETRRAEKSEQQYKVKRYHEGMGRGKDRDVFSHGIFY
jgi:hypothetical protein